MTIRQDVSYEKRATNKIQKHFNLQRMKKRQQAKEFREIVVTKKE